MNISLHFYVCYTYDGWTNFSPKGMQQNFIFQLGADLIFSVSTDKTKSEGEFYRTLLLYSIANFVFASLYHLKKMKCSNIPSLGVMSFVIMLSNDIKKQKVDRPVKE